MTKGIKACPLCGGLDCDIEHTSWDGSLPEKHVKCYTCGACGPIVELGSDEDAIEAWNIRPKRTNPFKESYRAGTSWYVIDGEIIAAKSEKEAREKAANKDFFSVNILGNNEVVDLIPTKIICLNIKDKSSLELFKEYKEYVDSLLGQTKGLGNLYNKFSAIGEELLLRLEKADNGF